jgi:hypothetical protein
MTNPFLESPFDRREALHLVRQKLTSCRRSSVHLCCGVFERLKVLVTPRPGGRSQLQTCMSRLIKRSCSLFVLLAMDTAHGAEELRLCLPDRSLSRNHVGLCLGYGHICIIVGRCSRCGSRN